MADNPTFEIEEGAALPQKEKGAIQPQLDAEAPPPPPPSPPPEEKAEDALTSELLYTVDDVPPWYMCILLGLQHYLTMVGATITIPFILTPLMCIDDNDPARGKLVSTIIFVSGIVTLLQATFGVRLPIIQGGTFSFLVPTIAILVTSFEACDALPLANMTTTEREEVWQVRMREIQGAIAVSAIFQVLVGFTGIIGILLTWITPLAIAPTVALVGLSLFEVAADKAAQHWGISFMTMALLILFSQYLRNVAVPIPAYSKDKGISKSSVYIFKLFPVLLAILISWGFCGILTASGVFPEANKARTDLTTDLLKNSPWFRIPYPGQWGAPTVSVAGVFGMLAGVLASMIESVGDYYACARLAGAPPPPTHAVNRGIGIEGIGCILAGVWGTGNGTTSYSENIGAIGVTKVGSRRVVQYGAVIMIIVGMLGKFCALFVTIPEPVVGGVFCVMFAMISAVGLSSLQFVDLNSSRNLFVLGFSLFFGLALPKWIESNPGVINTGDAIADQLLTVLLQTSMFVGGFLGFLLDNTVPGTPKERGLLQWRATKEGGDADAVSHTYDFPFGMDVVRKIKWMKYVPLSPTFTGFVRKRSS
ncbi:solute carrier family 23 member 1-like isoform X1 [Penaeus chinensis]|uniref:solute carrier family 23 member 1-like isoform X1 n=1 Tax=Penaeus chinensis TaxID=139456 RepID=UPI001FB65CFF|nr:solute carrier family 23 member 1-like isoform X1 [Penaeus chinensis]